jgi:C4-dicarboxylate-binding protein DctP
MTTRLTRRSFAAAAAATLSLAAPWSRKAAAAESLEFRLSLDTAPSHPRNVAMKDYLAKLEKASNGQIKPKIFESGSLFPDLHVVKALVQGQVEMAVPGTWTITGLVPDADFSALPAFYGQPTEIVHKATDGSAGEYVNKEITKKLHVEILGHWFDLGFNNWYSTKKPLKKLTDLKGMKIRSPGGVLISWRIRYFGGIPNVTAWPDVPLAMSQGTFDGLVTTNESANSSKLFDSGLRHSLQDHQQMGLYIPMINHEFWVLLGKENQEMMIKLWNENLPQYRANTAKAQEEGKKGLEQHGVAFVDVPQAERDAIRQKMLPEQDKAAADAHMSPEVVKLVMADVGA